ncbi:MAG: prepilin-type N-terminal cleavage/methylation domain-containing protein [Phycisphaerae bacterium]|jgi:prepilin-type N-terminal cleavage/methylation domain-containing protein
MMKKRSRARAFSLVELVIVVVIIGVIAAIAVPRISRGAKGAGESALRGNLASLRNAIDMFAAEHNGAWPGNGGTEAELIDHLTKKTDAGGTVGTVAGTHIYGPYLRGGFPPVPVGPNVGSTGVIMTTQADLTLAIDEADTTMGWIFNYQTGEIIVNTDDADESTTAYSSY